MRVAVIGAGWAGCAAAVEATRRGHQVLLLEASRQPGGRARRLDWVHEGQPWRLDNGQHILIGAYRETLELMRTLGVEPEAHLHRLPLSLRTPQGQGMALPAGWPPRLAVLAGVLAAPGWRARDKLSLLRSALAWQAAGFQCPPEVSVARLCSGLTPAVFQGLIEPLCVSALNTPAERASAQVFLRVMQDALFSERGGADLLLPRSDLSALLPDAALAWLKAQGQAVRLGTRVLGLLRHAKGWALQTACEDTPLQADAVLLACPAGESLRLLEPLDGTAGWVAAARGLSHEAIATVYANAPGVQLPAPMLALPSEADAPAQFVFDRGQLGGPAGLLAFVVSASQGERSALEAQVLAQGRRQLALEQLEAVTTVVDKRATFACTPGLERPGLRPVQTDDALRACGDYVAGPYPATLEGAVRSGLAAARSLG